MNNINEINVIEHEYLSIFKYFDNLSKTFSLLRKFFKKKKKKF